LAVVGVFLAAVAVAGCGGITPPTSPVPMYDAAAPPLRTIEGRAPRVLVVGDSIADQMGSHALFALEEMGIDARLHAAWGRGLFTRSQYDMGEPIPDPPSATLMHEATQAVIDFDPDVVAVYSNHNYWASTAPHDAAGNVIEMGSPAWDEMVQEQLAVLMQHLTVNGAVVYFVKPVPREAGRTAADNVIWNSYLAHRQEFGFGIINAGDILAAANGKHVQQLSDCAGDPRDVRPPDDLHLTYYGAGLSGSVLARALAQITGAPHRRIDRTGRATDGSGANGVGLPHGDLRRRHLPDGNPRQRRGRPCARFDPPAQRSGGVGQQGRAGSADPAAHRGRQGPPPRRGGQSRRRRRSRPRQPGRRHRSHGHL
jgi:hypothetical protein